MNPQLEELATLYVLDRLDPAERTAFESQLPGSPELTAFVRDLEAALAREIRSLPQHQPSADLLARIESRLDPAPAVVPSAGGAAPAQPLSPGSRSPAGASPPSSPSASRHSPCSRCADRPPPRPSC